nr:hypothetical protein [Tanacetum cinerariifolium]
MYTQEEQYTELLEPIIEPQQVPQNDNNVISEVTDVEQGGETVEQHPLALMAKAFKLNYSTPTNNNKRISSNPNNRQIAQPGIHLQAEEYDLMAAAADLDE